MVVHDGWESAAHYLGPVEEHEAVRGSAGAFDLCHTSAFRVFGSGAFERLQGLLTNDLRDIARVGSGQATLMCDDEGGIVADLTLYHSGDVEYLVAGGVADRALVSERLAAGGPGPAEVADESDRTGRIALQGPAALDVLAELGGAGGSVPERDGIGEGSVLGVPVLVARTGSTGEDGVELVCAISTAVAVWRGLMSVPEVTPCGLEAADTLRLETGRPVFGLGPHRGVDPLTAGSEALVALDKGRFVGREAIERIKADGVRRRLVGLRVAGGIPHVGDPLLHAGVEVGKVANGTFSPTLKTGIATAYVPSELAEPGTWFGVSVAGTAVRGVVERMPFVKRTSLSTDT